MRARSRALTRSVGLVWRTADDSDNSDDDFSDDDSLYEQDGLDIHHRLQENHAEVDHILPLGENHWLTWEDHLSLRGLLVPVTKIHPSHPSFNLSSQQKMTVCW